MYSSWLQSILHLTSFSNPQLDNIHTEIWGEGILYLTPKIQNPAKYALIISAGLHGNETAPVEIVDHLYKEIAEQKLNITQPTLLILGNPEALRLGKRFVNYDINRLFNGGADREVQAIESARAITLIQNCQKFAALSAQYPILHLDLHTAIRGSLIPQFGIVPFNPRPLPLNEFAFLSTHGIAALVLHNAPAGTFSYHTSHYYQASSYTLELGSAKPFGQNRLEDFHKIHQGIRLLLQGLMPYQANTRPTLYQTIDSVIKDNADFVLNLSLDAPNFTPLAQGFELAKTSKGSYIINANDKFILFPNPSVAIGERAGLIIKIQPCPPTTTDV